MLGNLDGTTLGDRMARDSDQEARENQAEKERGM
jgi:hypothetical protein